MTILFTILLLTLPLVASSSGLSVTPSRLEATITVDKPHSFTLTVENPTNEVALFEAYPDDFQALITVEPKSFTLEAGTHRKITVITTLEDAGTFSTLLSVVSRPLGDRSFKAGTGIKIPLQFEAVESDNGWPRWMKILALVDGLLGALLLWLLAVRPPTKISRT